IEVERKAVPAVALLDGALERSRGAAPDNDWRVWALYWMRMRLHVCERYEPSLIGGLRLAPHRPPRRPGFLRGRATVGERRAESPELGLEVADADSEDQPAARQNVEARQLLGKDQRVSLRQDDDAGAESHARRHRRRVGQRDRRIEDRVGWRHRRGR